MSIVIFVFQIFFLFVCSFIQGMNILNKNSNFCKKVIPNASSLILSSEGKKIISSLLKNEYQETTNALGKKNWGRSFHKYKDKRIYLDLSHQNFFSQNDIEGIKSFIPYKLSQVTELNASYNDLESIDVSQLHTAFPNLIRLDVSYNQIKKVSCIKTLSFKGPNPFATLKFALFSFWHMLGGKCPVSSVGFTAHPFEYLNLCGNRIEYFDPSCIPFYNLYLDLSSNKLSAKLQEEIQAALEKRKMNGCTFIQKLHCNFLEYQYGFGIKEYEYLNKTNLNKSNIFSMVKLDHQHIDD